MKYLELEEPVTYEEEIQEQITTHDLTTELLIIIIFLLFFIFLRGNNK